MDTRLIFSPHIDDEVLGCGGILNGFSHVVECGVDDFHIVSREERISELDAASRFLGFTYQILNQTVNRYNHRDMISSFEEIINRVKPKEVYIPYPSYNQDHKEVFLAANVALRPHDVNYFVPRVFIYEETQVNDWDWSFDLSSTFKPNYFQKIDIGRKLQAYSLLKSQVRSFRSPEYITSMAALRGKQSGSDYAEAFHCIRYINH